MSDNIAVLEGYALPVLATGGVFELALLIKPGTDLDSAFRAWDCDAQEFIRVNGWMFTFAEE